MIKKELNAYRKALFFYILTMILPFLSYVCKTDEGFCHYFDYDFGILSHGHLYGQKPLKSYSGRQGYWFKQGEKLPRIKCLIKAIKSCKNEIAL